MNTKSEKPWRVTRAGAALVDAAMWMLVYVIAFSAFAMTRSVDFEVSWAAVLVNGLFAGALQIIVGLSFRLYQGRYRFASLEEIPTLMISALIVSGMNLLGETLFRPLGYDVAVDLCAGGLGVVALIGWRLAWRSKISYEQRIRPGIPTLILGAGVRGQELVQRMQEDAKTEYKPVGFIDSHPQFKRFTTRGVKTLGGLDRLEEIVDWTHAKALVVAMPVDAAALQSLNSRCKAMNVKLRLMPSAQEIVGGAIKLGDLSDVSEEDLLGRRPVTTEETGIRAILEGKRVLVTGAGGSIGSEVARQVHLYNPAFLGMLDHDESNLHATQMSIEGRALLDTDSLILADIRDPERMMQVVKQVKPDIIIHAAALKHVTFLQRTPREAYKTNVIGTLNILKAAKANDVPVVVNISTDKAADPENALGYSKRTAERLTAEFSGPNRRYLSVRFGNVLGSRGSVLPAFRAMIAAGGPVTVTDPEVTRYFMTIPEAVHLVLQAAAIGNAGQTLILDMGVPVKIADVARELIERSGRAIDIEYTGLRPGEKLHEVLASENEAATKSSHPLINFVEVDPLAESSVPRDISDELAMEKLEQLALHEGLREVAIVTPIETVSPS